MSWICFVLDNPGAVLGYVLIVLWGLMAASAMTSGSGLMVEFAVLLSYWIVQSVYLFSYGNAVIANQHAIGHMHSDGGFPSSFLIGDIVFISLIVWDGLLSPDARKSKSQEKKRQAAIAAIAARGGFTDPRRNRRID